MSQIFFVLNAPPLSFSKKDLYNPDFTKNEICVYVKSIADTFFLSNQFRKNYFLYFCTEYKGKKYIITFDGSNLRYLGPSFFSAAHLLLRAKNHILDPNTKSGKLTPGISVLEESEEWIVEKHLNDVSMQIISLPKEEKTQLPNSFTKANVYLFGFGDKLTTKNATVVSLGPLYIDEQIIVTNYLIERDLT